MIDFHLQELNFTLFCEQFDPTILDLNTLQRVGAIKQNWQLAKEPIYKTDEIKLVFTNQVKITAQSNRIIFNETIRHKRLQDTHLAEAVISHVQGFPKLKYLAVSMNPNGYAEFPSSTEALKYISEGLLASTLWGKFQGQSISASGLKLAYPYKSGNFCLDINQVNIETGGREIPAIWFANSFNYHLLGANNEQRYLNLNNLLQDWHTDVTNCQDHINNSLLAISVIPSVSIFPL